MSYEIVKSVKIKDGKVFINSASNNCRPLTYDNNEYPYFTKILSEKGQTEAEIEILKNFEEGNLQSNLSNKYTRALKVLYYLFKAEYEPFNWRTERHNEKKELRNSEDFRKLLLKALNTKLPKEKFVVQKREGVFVRKETSRHIFYGRLEEAKKYDFKIEAERIATHIFGEVVSLNTLHAEQLNYAYTH